MILAAAYLRRVFDDGRSLAAGVPALTHVCTVGACGTTPRRGPPTDLPGAGVRRHALSDGSHCPSAAQRGHGAHAPSLFSAADKRQTKKKKLVGHQLRVDPFGVDLGFETARSTSPFNLLGLDSKLFSKVQIDSKSGVGSIGGSSPPPPRSVTQLPNSTLMHLAQQRFPLDLPYSVALFELNSSSFMKRVKASQILGEAVRA